MTSPNLEQVKTTEHNWRKYGEQWKMPSDARISSTWHYYESTLVAESAEPEDAPLKYMEYNLKEIKELVSGPSLVYWAKYLREGIVVTPYNERCGRKVGRVILKFVSPEYLGL